MNKVYSKKTDDDHGYYAVWAIEYANKTENIIKEMFDDIELVEKKYNIYSGSLFGGQVTFINGDVYLLITKDSNYYSN